MNNEKIVTTDIKPTDSIPETSVDRSGSATKSREYGGPKGLEPTRYGDWEQKGRCTDF